MQILLDGIKIDNEFVVTAKLLCVVPKIRMTNVLLMDEECIAECVADLVTDFSDYQMEMGMSEEGFWFTLEVPDEDATFAPAVSLQILFCIDDNWNPCDKYHGLYSVSKDAPKPSFDT